MQREGLVSTIIPVYNRPALLCEAVASVLAQTYRPIEIIIVDDGSTDDTPSVVAALVAANPVVVRSLQILNGGPGAAREAGRLSAAGEFIQYLDSDDLLLPRKFELQVQGLREHPDCGVAYGKTRYGTVSESSEDEPWKRTGEHIKWMFPSFLQSRWWGTSTPLYRRTVTDIAGSWSKLSTEEDWEYDCRIAKQGVQLYFCPSFISWEREHPGERLSRGGSTEPRKLCDRATAHSLILEHALAAGVPHESSEMEHFARELFLLARQCGAAGLPNEARMLFELARSASTPEKRQRFEFVAYRAFAEVIGWSLTGRLACQLDEIRR